MIEYISRYYDRLLQAALEHLELAAMTLVISLILAAGLTLLCSNSKTVSRILVNVLSMVYSIPSLAMFALLIPLTGLGKTTAVIVLVIYNQYLLLRNILAGLDEVDKGIVEAATGMGMTKLQILVKIKLPLARQAILAGVRIAAVSTVGIATIAASINAGGLGTILFDGLRTMNTAKILWGSLLSAVLAVGLDGFLRLAERKLRRKTQDN